MHSDNQIGFGRRFSSAAGILASAAVMAVICCTPAWAQSAKKWVQASEPEFAAGKGDNTAITGIGELKLGRQKDTIAEKAGGHVWSMAIDSKGTVYAGTGSGGEILKIVNGKSELFYKSEEPEITSLAVDKADNLYAGTAPGGLIYKFKANGEPEIYLDSEATYIWALAFNSKGVLYAATGDEGKLLKVTEPGKAETVFETKDPHILDVVVDSKDNVYVCTNKSGLVFRIDPAGKAFALFDSDDEEMHTLAVDTSDNLYVCTADGLQPGTAGLPAPDGPQGPPGEKQPGPAAGKISDNGEGLDDDGGDGGDEPPKDEPPKKNDQQHKPKPVLLIPPMQGEHRKGPVAPEVNGINFVYKITPEGIITSLFRREGAALLAMVWQNGSIYLGTANQGEVLQLTDDLQETGLAQVEQPQVSALVAAPDGTLYFGTAGSEGRIYRLGGKTAAEGTFTSVVKDLTYPSQWGVVRCMGDFPDGTSVTVATRSGNVAEPDKTWSDWSPEQKDPAAGAKITSPAGRFIQYRLHLKGADEPAVPLIRSVEVNYLPPNHRPRITGISFPQSQEGQGPPSGPPGPLQSPARVAAKAPDKPLKGIVEISWQTEDPNSDQLKYEVFYKGANETAWKSIVDKLRDARLTWNTWRVPDGVYRLKVRADDEPSNSSDRSLTTDEISEPFVIDNTPPTVTVKTKVEGDGKVSVTAELADAVSAIDDSAYSIDSVKWILASPEDGIFDSPRETVLLKTEILKPGEHTIIVNARDAAGNVGAGKAVVVVP